MADFKDAEMRKEKSILFVHKSEKMIASAQEAEQEAVKLKLIEGAVDYFQNVEERRSSGKPAEHLHHGIAANCRPDDRVLLRQ